MRILMLHNRYKIRGGEDESTEAEIELLREAGHSVDFLEARNDEIRGTVRQVSAAVSAIWSPSWHRTVETQLSSRKYDILHVQNFFPLMSPSIYYAAAKSGTPVVQTVHNYRLVCPSANLLRNAQICSDCVGKTVKWPSVLHGCYRGSRLASASVAAMTELHGLAGTWRNRISRYVAVSDYVAERMRLDGFPTDRISLKPNFVRLNSDRPILPVNRRKHVLFVGRLAVEKGCDILLEAWRRCGMPLPLKMVGEGDFANQTQTNVEFLGRRDLGEVYDLMREAACVVMPGRWPEPFGRVAIEAFANGTPVISSDQGGVAELIEHGQNGRLFRSGDIADLARTLSEFIADDTERARCAQAARRTYEALYTPSRNLELLEGIYALAITQKR